MMASRPSSNIPKDKMDPDGDAPTSDSTNYLKFGKKIYFAESSSSKSPPPRPPTQADNPSSPAGRKGKGSVAQPPRCQVEGCNVDLTGSKGYYCRHKVCAMHSKSPRVVVASIAQRFCQQCSRFHELKEFDEGKRSCRRRLSDHNQRRRKPPNPPFSTRFPREYPNQYRGYLDFTCPPPPLPPPPTNRDLWSVTRPVNPFQAPFVPTGSSMFSPGPNPFYLPAENIRALSLLSTNDFAVNNEASHHLVSVASYNSNEPIGFRANGPDMGPNGPEFGGDEFELALQNNGPDTTGHDINWSDM